MDEAGHLSQCNPTSKSVRSILLRCPQTFCWLRCDVKRGGRRWMRTPNEESEEERGPVWRH